MATPPSFGSNVQNCLRYWDLADSLRIDNVVALWCSVEPSDIHELRTQGITARCVDAKRAAIEDSLHAGKLEYIDEGIPLGSGKIWMAADMSELIAKNRLRIPKDSLRRWFEDMPIDERPEFHFEKERAKKELPDDSEVAEINSNLGIAILAEMLAESVGKFRHGDRPNAAQIGAAVNERAMEHFGGDKHGLKAFHKKITKALNILEEQKERF